MIGVILLRMQAPEHALMQDLACTSTPLMMGIVLW